MENETMSMLTRSMQHPYLYTMIKLNPALVAIDLSLMIRSSVMLFRRK